ncbi:hypothetical protein FSP39_012972, partial [Pinctada imbricata]
PLSKQDTTVLERNMAFLIEEMMEVSLLIPYLTADGILSLLSGKYITDKKSRSDRIMALLDILSTNERGLDAFISALQKTDQCHISQRLQGTLFITTPCKDYIYTHCYGSEYPKTPAKIRQRQNINLQV